MLDLILKAEDSSNLGRFDKFFLIPFDIFILKNAYPFHYSKTKSLTTTAKTTEA